MKLVTDDVPQAGVEAIAARDGMNREGRDHDLQGLGGRMKSLQYALSDLGDEKDFEVLLSLIHKPGRTTVAEFELVAGIVESMHAQANILMGLKQLVTAATRTIVRE